MLSLLLILCRGIELNVTHGYHELDVPSITKIKINTFKIKSSTTFIVFINNEEFYNLPLYYRVFSDTFEEWLYPNNPTVLKYVIFNQNEIYYDHMLIVYNGGDREYNTINITGITPLVLFVSSTEFNYKFETTTTTYYLMDPYDEIYEIRNDFDIHNRKFLLVGFERGIIHFKAEKVNPNIPTQGIVAGETDCISYDPTYQFRDNLTIQSGKYELIIDETPTTLQMSTYFPDNYYDCIAHQSKDIVYQNNNSEWVDFPVYQLVDYCKTFVIKSRSGKKNLKLQLVLSKSGNDGRFSHIDVVLNPEDGKVYIGNTTLGSEKVIFASWYVMSFRQYFDYQAKINVNYPILDCFGNVKELRCGAWLGYNSFMKYKFKSLNSFWFGAYDFKALFQEDLSGFNRGIFSSLSNTLIEEKQVSDIIVSTNYIEDGPETIDFNENETRLIYLSSLNKYFSILVFKNAHEFTLEDGSPLNPVYTSANESEVKLFVKPKSGVRTLRVGFYENRYAYYNKVDILVNDFDVGYKFEESRKSIVILASSVESVLSKKSYLGYNNNYINTKNGDFMIIDTSEYKYIVGFKNKTKLPEGIFKGRYRVPGCGSLFDTEVGLILLTGEVKTITVDEKPIKIYLNPRPFSSNFNIFIHGGGNIDIQYESTNEDDRYIIKAINGTQRVVLVYNGVYDSNFEYDSRSPDSEISYNELSSEPIGYIVRTSKINHPQIYSFHSFSTNVSSYSPISFTAVTNDGQRTKYKVSNENTITLNSVNMLDFDGSHYDLRLSRIIFDEPDKVSPFTGNYTNGILLPIWAPRTPEQTPEITPEPTQISSSFVKPDEDNKEDDQKSGSGKLGGGAIAGIVIGIVIVVAICVTSFILIKKYKTIKEQDTEVTFMNVI